MPPPEPASDAVTDGAFRLRGLPRGADASLPTAPIARLFRTEVLAERQTQWLGTVLLTPRLSHRVFTLFAALAVAAILALMAFADFTRRARVSGWLMPEQGLVRVFTPRAGVVTGLDVAEGTEVRRGDRLMTISAELESAALGATQAEIARRLVDRRESLLEERERHEQLVEQQRGALTDRIAALGSELAELDREIELLQSRVSIAERTATLQRDLRAQGFVSELLLQQAEGERLEQSTRLSAMTRARIALSRDQQTAQSELEDLPLKAQAQTATLERDISLVEQELAEAEAQREIVVSASEDGTVTAILAERGSYADTSRPLLAIVPSGAKLEARLYGASRAVGFLRSGQRVLLRYEAYPYQKFGHYDGVIASVSRSPVSPAELPPQAVGGTAAWGAGSEPVYRITVSLERQTVTAYGEQVPLQPGMQLEADVALETRPIFEWVLDPLYTLTGKWRM
jgi:membrane fusion protein